jgi:hypothetical protein
MTSSEGHLRRAAAGYLHRTHRPLNCLMFLLPLLAAYEAGAVFYRDRLLAPRHLAMLMDQFGASARFLPPLVIVVVLVAWHAASRQRWQVDADAVLGMLVESVLLMVPMIGLGRLTDRLLEAALQAGPEAARSLPAEVLSGMGAGIYEEFLFRLVGIGLIMLICVDLLKGPRGAVAAVAVVTSSARRPSVGGCWSSAPAPGLTWPPCTSPAASASPSAPTPATTSCWCCDSAVSTMKLRAGPTSREREPSRGGSPARLSSPKSDPPRCESCGRSAARTPIPKRTSGLELWPTVLEALSKALLPSAPTAGLGPG